jgi:hypothetical protein
MRATAGFHTNQAGWYLSKEGEHLLAPKALLQHRRPSLINQHQLS